jgi:predicted AAA+ superfamily ATPase
VNQRPRYLPRHIDEPLAKAMRTAPVVVLDGPRGAGKTTTAARLAASIVMLPRDQEQLLVDPESYLRALTPPILLDEWQLAGTELLWTVKRIVDDDPTPGRLLLTGSVEPAAYGPTHPLTGRAVRLVMRPMTTAELDGNGAARTFLGDVLAGQLPPLGSGVAEGFDLRQLGRAGFPAARDLPDARLFFDAYASLISQRAGDEGRDGTRLLRAMRVLATLTAQAVPDQRIWEAADVNKATWRHYDDLLTRTHLAAPIPAFESNRLTRLTAYPKRHLADTAMALALSGLTAEDLKTDPSTAGRYLESFVMQQLRPQVDAVGGALMHVRTGAGAREVDAVVEVGPTLVGIEVKLGPRPTQADARPLGWLREQLGDRLAHGFVVHTGRDCYPLGERLMGVPLSLVAGCG